MPFMGLLWSNLHSCKWLQISNLRSSLVWRFSKVTWVPASVFDTDRDWHQCKCMARPSRKSAAVVALICIVLILLFLTVKEVGRYHTHLPVTNLRGERALPEEVSLIVAAVVVTTLISCKGGQSESSLITFGLSQWSPTTYSLSALRC